MPAHYFGELFAITVKEKFELTDDRLTQGPAERLEARITNNIVPSCIRTQGITLYNALDKAGPWWDNVGLSGSDEHTCHVKVHRSAGIHPWNATICDSENAGYLHGLWVARIVNEF